MRQISGGHEIRPRGGLLLVTTLHFYLYTTRAKFVTTTNMTHWGAVLVSKEGVYVLLGLCRRNP